MGFTGCRAGEYARKHNPWTDFSTVPPAANQPLSAMPADYAALPTISFVIPNLCHDMHDCSIAQGDAWLRQNIDGYAQWARTHNSLLIVSFDESESNRDRDNHIATLAVGPAGAGRPDSPAHRPLRPAADPGGSIRPTVAGAQRAGHGGGRAVAHRLLTGKPGRGRASGTTGAAGE